MRILIVCGIAVCAAAQTIDVTPPKAMIDEAVVVKVSGLAPNEHATIRAELTDGGGRIKWRIAGEAGGVARVARICGARPGVFPLRGSAAAARRYSARVLRARAGMDGAAEGDRGGSSGSDGDVARRRVGPAIGVD